jgi:hypothetical protein
MMDSAIAPGQLEPGLLVAADEKAKFDRFRMGGVDDDVE